MGTSSIKHRENRNISLFTNLKKHGKKANQLVCQDQDKESTQTEQRLKYMRYIVTHIMCYV